MIYGLPANYTTVLYYTMTVLEEVQTLILDRKKKLSDDLTTKTILLYRYCIGRQD